ncbi:MAG: type II toxin-antitoxin system RelE/ParE family toxin [Promicromonosporaceae bacterium]|nr:type II toxin-antitoxin system RelE/ParE family toxin [Promicromonosporaceae bacterium]
MSLGDTDIKPAESAWVLAVDPAAERALKKLDRIAATRIRRVLVAVAASGDPRSRGRGLTGNRSGMWRYRVGDYRIIVDIQDDRLVVLALEIGHRSAVYA